MTDAAAARSPLTLPGMERTIPLRVIHLLPGAAAADNISAAELVLHVQDANDLFKAAGIQFYVGSVERLVMPAFATMYMGQPEDWSVVDDELKLAFPAMPLNAWPAAERNTRYDWLQNVTAVYGAKHEVVVWTHATLFAGTPQSSSGTINYAVMPWRGRAMVNLTSGSPQKRFALAHELGHAMGLRHPEDENHVDALDPQREPRDYSLRQPTALWDLIYTPPAAGQGGASSVTYTSKAEAVAAAQAGKTFCTIRNPDPVAGCPSDCTVNGAVGTRTGASTCTMHGVNYTTGDGKVQGLTRQVSALPATNVMWAEPNVGQGEFWPTFFSASQLEVMRDQLRWEMPLDSVAVNAIQPPGGVQLSSDRVNLGAGDSQRGGAFPVDFDGDGKRDLALWTPPTTLATASLGTLRVRPSSATGQTWAVSVGLLGDVPWPGDYDKDGCTDVAVWRQNGSDGTDLGSSAKQYLIYCESPGAAPSCGAPTCSTVRTVEIGTRGAVPLASTRFDGQASGQIAMFRAATGAVWWRNYVANGSNGRYPTIHGAKVFGARLGAVPVVGDYDDDGKTDPAIYLIDSGRFEIMASSASYAVWTRDFGPLVIPNDGTGLPADDRAASIPMEGVGIFFYSRPSVYIPQSQSWITQWDMTAGASPSLCGTPASPRAFPVSPNVDRDGDWRTDFVTFEANTINGGVLRFKASSNGTCSGATKVVTLLGWGDVFVRAWSSGSDMSGDGKPEIILYNSHSAEFRVLPSTNDYDAAGAYSVVLSGDYRSIPL